MCEGAKDSVQVVVLGCAFLVHEYYNGVHKDRSQLLNGEVL